MKAAHDTATIYVLADSRETDPIARVRYVGRTVRSLEMRLKGHRWKSDHGERTARACWMRSVYAAGGNVLIEAVAVVPVLWSAAAEIDWIEKYRSAGYRLLNHTAGGDGLLNPTEETRRRIGAAKRGNKFWVGKKHTEAAKAKIAALARGRPMHPNTRQALKRPEVGAKISQTKRNQDVPEERLAALRAHAATCLHSAEARAKMRATVQTPEYRATISARQRTPEALERIRGVGLANAGRAMSAEFKAGCAARGRERRASEATKRKMSAWQRGGDSHRAKLTWEDVAVIRSRHKAGGVSQHQLARDYHVQPRTINLIVHNKTWVVAA